MSKENLVQFIGSVAKNEVLAEGLTQAGTRAEKWVEVGAAAGFEFTTGDLKDFISEALDTEDVDESSMIEAYLSSSSGDSELGEDDLEMVAGGIGATASRTLSHRLSRSLSRLGYFSGFGDQAVWYAPMGPNDAGLTNKIRR